MAARWLKGRNNKGKGEEKKMNWENEDIKRVNE